MYKYKWQDSFYNEKSVCPQRFIEKVFEHLNHGTPYYDIDGEFMGYIAAIQGNMGIIHIISDHSLDKEGSKFIKVEITYLDMSVLYLRIDRDKLHVLEFQNGWWANTVYRRGKEYEKISKQNTQ